MIKPLLAILVSAFLLSACGDSASVTATGGGSSGAGSSSGSSSGGTPGTNRLTVVVVVVDSLMPSDVDNSMPNLRSLMAQGTFYPQSRSVFSAETIPNHVAMMTGVYPSRSGIPTNNFLDSADTERDLSLPEELTANTLFTWINQQCKASGRNPDIRHGATMSKKYLYEIFEGDAANAALANDNPSVFNAQPDTHWDPTTSPAYIGPGSEHTPDTATMTQALSQLGGADFMFINLGDVDRAAHASGLAGRSGVKPNTDTLLGQLVSNLQSSGRWANTVLIVASDHGMDFTLPGPSQSISTQAALTALGRCFTPMTAVQNGGTNSIYVNDRSLPLAQKQEALRAARGCLLGTSDCATLCLGATRPASAANIIHAWYTVDDPTDPTGNMPDSIDSAHPNLGDLVLVASQGMKFSEPDARGNPIPGNHGHLATIHNFMLVTGGSPWVKANQVVTPSMATPGPFDRLPEQSENIDIAPTVAWLLGLGIQANQFPDGRGFDGRVLREAFMQFDGNPNAPEPTSCGRF